MFHILPPLHANETALLIGQYPTVALTIEVATVLALILIGVRRYSAVMLLVPLWSAAISATCYQPLLADQVISLLNV